MPQILSHWFVEHGSDFAVLKENLCDVVEEEICIMDLKQLCFSVSEKCYQHLV